jgi:Zn-finger nucleic acid-binding protein
MAKCTSCSAPLPTHNTACDYCGTRNNVDLKGVHEYTVTTPESDRLCPRCKVKMQTINIQGEGTFLIEQCKECFGLFFDPGELEALLETSVTNVFQIDYKRINVMTQAQGLREVRYDKCPICGTIMNRINFGARSGVIVDRCKGHGVWLDGGELRQLLEWRKAGGQLLHEKVRVEREKAEAKQQREKAAMHDALMQSGGGGSSSSWSDGGFSLSDGLDLPDLLIGLVERLFR